jgi:hypothetical protein
MSFRQAYYASQQRAIYATMGMRMMVILDMGYAYRRQIDQDFGRCMAGVRR